LPGRFVLRRHGAQVMVEISADGLDPGMATLITAALARMVGVLAVGVRRRGCGRAPLTPLSLSRGRGDRTADGSMCSLSLGRGTG
jgi:hypothetical protein